MSRYHPVRPKQQQHRQVPQSAAPAQPTQAEMQAKMEEFASERFQSAVKHLYEMNDGLELDASIARCKRTLEQYDRELEIVAKEDGSKQHRWTISPSIAFRFDKSLHELLARKEKLMAQCYGEAQQVMQRFLHDHGPQPEGNSLCPPKWPTPAEETTSANTNAAPAERTKAETGPIAA